MQTTSIKTIYKSYESLIGSKIIVNGRVRSLRDSKTFGFIELNDGSYLKNLQIVFEQELENFNEVVKYWRSSHKSRMSKASFWTQSYKNNAFRSSRWNIPSPKKETLFWISQNYRPPQTENKHFFSSIQSKKSAFFRYS